MEMAASPNPSAFRAPISARWSSTMRVMEVRELSAATRKNTTGNTVARSLILSASFVNST